MFRLLEAIEPSMLAFLRKNQILLSSGFCLLLSLYILTAAARGQLQHDPIGPILLWLMRPLQLGAQVTAGWIKDIQQSYITMGGYKSENERLRKHVQQLEVERNRLLEAGRQISTHNFTGFAPISFRFRGLLIANSASIGSRVSIG